MRTALLASSLNAQRGATIISTMIAAGIIVSSIGAIAVPAMNLHKAMRKSELANLAVVIEANMVSAFHNKINFDNTTVEGKALNDGLRAGTLPAVFKLQTSFKAAPLEIVSVSATESAVVGFLQRDLAPCAAFSHACVLRYEIRLKKTGATDYAFSYQIDSNPAVLSMAPLGDVTSFSAPVDPGLFRADAVRTNCDPATHLFMNGMNRDTGEAFCVEKPTTQKCPDGQLPKGLIFEPYPPPLGATAGVLRLACSAPLRTFKCDQNFALQRLEPPYVDPANSSYAGVVPGTCVFRTADTGTMPNSLPPNPTSPYVRSMTATVCPPYYKAGNPAACQLVPDAARNAGIGRGRCGTLAYKNCTRSTTTTAMVSDGGAAHAAYLACLLAPPALPATCGLAPPNPQYNPTTVCAFTQVSQLCNGAVTSGGSCADFGPWSAGTPYSDNVVDVAPTATTSASFSNRGINCSFTDTSSVCTSPPVDLAGNPVAIKTAKWYGGVRVAGALCTLDPVLVGTPTKSAF